MTKVAEAMPETLGACADQLYELRELRLELQRQVDELSATEARLRDHVIRQLGEQGATAVAGHAARAGITTQQVGAIKDWSLLAAHLQATGDFGLLQRRLNDGALRERWEAQETVPGVEPFVVVKLSLTKVR